MLFGLFQHLKDAHTKHHEADSALAAETERVENTSGGLREEWRVSDQDDSFRVFMSYKERRGG